MTKTLWAAALIFVALTGPAHEVVAQQPCITMTSAIFGRDFRSQKEIPSAIRLETMSVAQAFQPRSPRPRLDRIACH